MPDLQIAEFLKEYPWRGDETGGRVPLDFLWKFSLKESLPDLWPFLIDTSTFNKLLGLPQMTYVEKNGRLFGSAKNAGILSEWEEVPWEWEYHRGLNNARIYSRGFATYVRSRYLLKPAAAGSGTDFYVYFGWVPRGLLGRLLLKVGMPGLKKSYAAALAKIGEAIRIRKDFEARQRSVYAAASPVEKNPEIAQRIAALTERAVAAGADAADIGKLAAYITTATDEELTRIRLKPVARGLGVALTRVIPAALYASRVGLLSLSWDVTCPHCRGVRKTVDSLGDVPGEERCDACDITFSTEEIGNMEVVFHVNPEIRRAEKKFYCAAEPATKRHIYIQRRVAARATLTLDTDLEPGEYRARVVGNKKYLPLSVGAGNEVRGLIGRHLGPLKTAEHPQLVFENPHDRDETLVIERREEDNDALRPAELFSTQIFRDLFGGQSLADGLKIELGNQNILFTDIVGSTSLYLKSGDGEAFQSVRKHFQKTYEIVRAFNGAVVKTIGDAAMVAFADALQCARAAVELQNAFDGSAETGGVSLRISIHAGPCLAVNLNNGIDYFGNTVNYAAKIQQFAGAGEIAFSPEFFADTRVRDYLAGLGLHPTAIAFKPAWAEAAYTVHRVRVGLSR